MKKSQGSELSTFLSEPVERRELLRRAGAAGLSLAVLGAIPGCGSDSSGGGGTTGGGSKGRLAFSHPDVGTSSDIIGPLLQGVREGADARGYELLIGSGQESVERQVAEVRTWIAQGLDGVTIGVRDPRALAPLAKEAKGSGTAFVSYVAPVPGADGVLGFDNVQAGSMIGDDAARWINEVKGGKAEVALLELSNVRSVFDRTEYARRHILARAPGARIVARQDAALAPEALKATQSILQAHPDVSVIICIADDGALGARQAMLQAGKDPDQVYVAGMDGGKRNLELILKGGDPIKASGALDLVDLGRTAIDLPANVVERRQPTSFNAKYVLASAQNKAETERLLAQYQ